jgi:hypothetical protein
MNRPRESDPDVIELAVQKILPEVVAWCREGNDESEDSEIAADLRAEIYLADDGYDFCKKLERLHSWSCDSALVDILHNADLSGARREMERKWVAAYRVFPGQLIGNEITYKGHPATITALHDTGHYTVNVPALGHVKEGLGTHGGIVAWEVIDGKVNMLGLTVTGPLLEATA